MLLFNSNIVKIWRESGRLLLIFLISSIGTVAGTIIAFFLLRDLIPGVDQIAAMLAGSYTGGGVNFAAMASRFEVAGETVSSTVVADNLLMAIYFLVLIAIPAIGFFRRNYTAPHQNEVEAQTDPHDNQAASYWKRKDISLSDIALAVASSFVIVAVSFKLAEVFSNLIPENANIFLTVLRGIIGDDYLMLTTITLLLVSFVPRFFESINGAQEIGTFLIYIFFVVIGVPANIWLILQNAPLILVFAAIIVFINMTISFTAGRLFKFDLEEVVLSTNANIGGPTTAAAMAISRGWTKLVAPILIVGTLGYIIGNYLGTGLGIWFSSMM